MQEIINPEPEIIQHLLQPDDHFPNNPSLPLLIYKKCVGAYPNGKDYNIHCGEPGEVSMTQNEIAKVPVPETDPVFGENGLLKQYWLKNKVLVKA